MIKKANRLANFIIDKLTNSIENIRTGEMFATEIMRLEKRDRKLIIKKDWQFNWVKEITDQEKEVYQLCTINNIHIIQGLISIEDKQDHVFLHLVESAIFNKGKKKFI